MNNIQSKVLYILKSFIELCQFHGLKWFIDGGTLLGTIRNNSFIKWDDDIDVCMPRKDFDKLSELMHDDSHFDDLFWQDPITDPEYFNIHARLRLDGTTAIGERELGINSHKGIFIDVYPIDEVPDKTEKLCKFLHDIRDCAESMNDKTVNAMTYDIMQHVLRNQRGDKVGALCFSSYKKYANVAVSKHAYHSCINAKFENLMVNVPIGYDEILGLWYGDDYMTPKHEDAFHESFIDADHDYCLYDNAKTMNDLSIIKERLLSN